MMIDERKAKELLDGLRARYGAPYSPSDKDMIERLYYSIFGRVFAPTSCQNCYHDAVIEMSLHMKNGRPMASEKNYVLKAGAIICNPAIDDGKVYTNANLTDEVAAKYLEMYPQKENLFAKIQKKARKTDRAQKKADGGVVVKEGKKKPTGEEYNGK